MKLALRFLVCAALLPLAVACEDRRSTPEKIEDKVKDGMDARPNERVKDAGEDLKDAGRDVKDAAKDAGRDIKDAAKDATN